MTIIEKVSYLKGLADGLNIDTEKSKEGKLIASIIDVLEEVGLAIEDIEEVVDEMGEELDAISDDLSDVEEVIFEDEDEDEDGCGCGCGCDDEDENDFFEVDCPTCGEDIFIDGAALEHGVVGCDHCEAEFSISNEEEEGGCCGGGCCGGDHHHEGAEA